MDHALRTISYIADIGDLLVIMARRGPLGGTSPPREQRATSPHASAQQQGGGGGEGGAKAAAAAAAQQQSQTKICCHVFESDEVQTGSFCICLIELAVCN